MAVKVLLGLLASSGSEALGSWRAGKNAGESRIALRQSAVFDGAVAMCM